MTLEEWINANPKIKAVINWPDIKTTSILNFNDWTAEMREDLEKAYETIVKYQWLVMQDPPENMYRGPDDALPGTYLREKVAWEIYVAHIAQSLAVEIQKWVNWSLLAYNAENLENLLDGRYFYRVDKPKGLYFVDWDEMGDSTAGTPTLPFALLKQNKFIATTRLKTIANLLEWCRKELRHYGMPIEGVGRVEGLMHHMHWQYRGYVPVSRVIMGTIRKSEEHNYEETKTRHWTAGCYGTAGFLRNVLKTVNIPVKLLQFGNHFQVFFPTEGKYLSHADDPYKVQVKTAGYPIEFVMLESQEYVDIFGDGNADDEYEVLRKIGFKIRGLTARFIPLITLFERCKDISANKSLEESDVFKNLKARFTMDELQEMNLWGRLDGKIEAYGGCEKLPRDDDYLWDTWKKVLKMKDLAARRKMTQRSKRDFSKLQLKPKEVDTSTLQRSQSRVQAIQPGGQKKKPNLLKRITSRFKRRRRA